MADEKKIRAIRPDGKVVRIPLSSLPEAIRKKYRPADGSFLQSSPEAKAPLSLENQHPLEGIGRALWNIVSSPAAFIPQNTAEAVTSFLNPLGNPLIMKRIAVDPLNRLSDEAKKDIAEGRTSEGRAKAFASGVPFLGPMASDLGKRAGTGDVSGAATEGLTYAFAPKVGEGIGKLVRNRFPEGFSSQAATRPIVQKYLFDRSLSVRNMISQAANTFDKMIGEKWSQIEKSVDAKHPEGAIDASNLRAGTRAAKEELIASEQKLPTAVKQIEAKGQAPRVMGSRLDLSNPIHKGLYDRLVEEGALPSADKISWQESRQIRSKLGRELRGGTQLSGEAKALGWRIYDDLTAKMRDAADTVNLGPQFDLANKLHAQYMQDFVDYKSPLAKAIKGRNPHGVMEPLSSPRYAEEARRMAGKYRSLGIQPEMIFKEGNLFQKYKSGLPKQWEANRWEMTADLFTGGIPTAVRMTHNLLSRAKALRELQP